MKNLGLILALISTLIGSINCPSAFANKEAGNGGDAIQIGNKLYLLDLVEAGVEENPQIDLTAQPSEELSKRVNQALPQGFPKTLVAKKLAEIERINPMMARILLKAIEVYQWKLVNSALIDIADENTELKIPKNKLFQLAIRKSASILVDRALWQKIDDGNKTALVFHEVLYALDKPRNSDLFIAYGYPAQYQSSEKAREINGYLFSELSSHGQEGLERFSDFSHITSTYSGGIFEDGAYLKANPFLQFELPSKEKNISYGGIELETPPSSKEEQINTACTIALKSKLPLKLNFYEGSKIRVGLSFFNTFEGQRNYVTSDYRPGYSLPAGMLSPQNEVICVSELTKLVYDKLDEMKRDYK
jgi:hypothetical protein